MLSSRWPCDDSVPCYLDADRRRFWPSTPGRPLTAGGKGLRSGNYRAAGSVVIAVSSVAPACSPRCDTRYLEAAALRWAAEDRGPGGSRVAGVIAAAMKPQHSQMTMKVVIPYPGSVAAKCTSDCPRRIAIPPPTGTGRGIA